VYLDQLRRQTNLKIRKRQFIVKILLELQTEMLVTPQLGNTAAVAAVVVLMQQPVVVEPQLYENLEVVLT
jgi:hypothetical protein